jgi:predicted ATPase
LLYLLRGHRQAADELAEQLFNLAQSADDPVLIAIAHYAMANNLVNAGEFVSSCHHFEQSLALYETHGRRSVFLMGEELGVVCRGFMSVALWPLGYPDRALRSVEEGLRLATEQRSPYDVALALSTAMMVHQRRREPQLTRECAEALIAITTEQGLSGLAPAAAVYMGWALVEQNQPEEGIRQILLGIEAYSEGGYMLDYHLPILAEGYRKIGQIEAGLGTLHEAVTLLDKTGTRYYEAELHRLKGELLLMRSAINVAQAENSFRHAIEVARRQSAKSWELRATTSLARLRASEGRRDEARKMLAQIYNWFTEGFDTADLKEAKAQLEELK